MYTAHTFTLIVVAYCAVLARFTNYNLAREKEKGVIVRRDDSSRSPDTSKLSVLAHELSLVCYAAVIIGSLSLI